MKYSKATIVFCLFLSACITETDLSGDVQGLDRLVVDGDFTDHGGAHQLRLWRPNRYGLSKFEVIQGAQVQIFDNSGNSAFYEPRVGFVDPASPDYYYELPAQAIPAVPGEAYYIRIKLADGREYRSEPAVLPGKIPIDSIHIRGEKLIETGSDGTLYEQKKALVEASFRVPEGSDTYWLRYDAHSVGFFEELPPQGPFEPQRECYLTDRFTNQKIISHELKNGNGKALKVLVGYKDVNYHFEKSIYFTVIQRSITREAYAFWQNAAKVANPQGSVFDPPPGAIASNIRCTSNPDEIPLGYFEVAAVDTLRRQLFNGDLGQEYYVNPYCFYGDFGTPNRVECKDCILLRNSSYKKPWYWK